MYIHYVPFVVNILLIYQYSIVYTCKGFMFCKVRLTLAEMLSDQPLLSEDFLLPSTFESSFILVSDGYFCHLFVSLVLGVFLLK